MIRLDFEASRVAAWDALGVDRAAFLAVHERIALFASETDRTGEIPAAFWDTLDCETLNRCLIPSSHGGIAAVEDPIKRLAIFEDLAWACPAYAMAMPGPGLATPPLKALASPEQLNHWFGRFRAPRPIWAAFAMTEPDVGSDATAIRTYAVEREHSYVINGMKCFITNGARADFIIVFATTRRGAGRFAIKAFVVPSDTPGFSVVRKESMLGLRGSQLAQLAFEDCEISKDNLIDEIDRTRFVDAFSAAQAAWDFMRPILTATIVGTCRRLRDEVARLLGIDPTQASPPALRAASALLHEMDRRLLTSRLLAYKAAYRQQLGLEASKDASMAKAWASRAAAEMAEQAWATFGFLAMSRAPLLEKILRDVKAFDIQEGTGEMQRLMVARMHARRPVDFADDLRPPASPAVTTHHPLGA
jgi:acyl-CoA dehydrogenase